MATHQVYDLVAGPEKWDLILGLFDDKVLTFTLLDKKGKQRQVKVFILSASGMANAYRLDGWEADTHVPISCDWDLTNRTGEMKVEGLLSCFHFDMLEEQCEEDEDDGDEDDPSDYDDVNPDEYEEGTPEDALTDFVDSWSPVHGVTLPEGHPDHDGHP